MNVEISGTDINKAVGKAFFESCIGDIWGEDISSSIREFAIEIARNAFTHGMASKFIIAFEPHKITLRDDGKPFSLSQLTNNSQQRGGGAAASQIQTRFKDQILISYIRHSDENTMILALIRAAQDIRDITPCTVQFNMGSITYLYEDLMQFCETHQECGVVYLVPEYALSYSDGGILARRFQNGTRFGQRVVLVCTDISTGLEEYIKGIAPDLVLMKIRS